MKSKLIMAAAVLGSSLVLAAAPAQARHWHHGGWHHGGWHHGGWGWGAGAAGFAAGALVGSALAAPYYYGGPYYGGPYYDEGPYAYEAGPGGDAEAYCEQRFRSYDPESGTYLGYDGRRHPCP
jgi:hypothetical protein